MTTIANDLDETLANKSLYQYYKNLICLNNEHLLSADDDKSSNVEHLREQYWHHLERVADGSRFANDSAVHEVGLVYLHDRSIRDLLPASVKRDKVMAARYIRQAFTLGFAVPETHSRWIFKKKYVQYS